MTADIEKKQIEIEELKAKNVGLGIQVDSSKGALEEAQTSLMELQGRFDTQGKDLRQLENDLNKNEEELTTVRKELEVSVESLGKEKEAHSLEVQSLKSKLDSLTAKHHELDERHRALLTEKDQLSVKLSELNGTSRKLEEQVEELESSKRELEVSQRADQSAHLQSLEQYESEKNQLNAQLAANRNEISSLTDARDQAEQYAIEIDEEKERLIVAHSDLVEKLNEDKSKTEAELREQKIQWQSLHAEKTNIEKKVVEVSEQLGAAQENIKALDEKLSSAKAKATKDDKKVTELEAALASEKEEVETLKQQKFSVESQRESVQKQFDDATAELKLLKIKASEFEVLNTRQTEELSAARNEVVEKDSEISQLEEDLENLKKKRIRVVQPLARQDSESGYSSDGYSESEPNSPTKPLQLDSSLEEQIKRLSTFTVEGVKAERERTALVASFTKIRRDLLRQLQELEDKYNEDFEVILEQPPSLTQKRADTTLCYEKCQEGLKETREAFASATIELEVDDLVKVIDDSVASADRSVSVLVEQQQQFDAIAADIDQSKLNSGSADPLEGTPPEDIRQMALLELQSALKTLSGEVGEESRAYAAGAMARTVHKLLVETGTKALRLEAQEPDQLLLKLEQYRQALYGILPEHLPLDMAGQVPEVGKRYLSFAVADAVKKLEAVVRPEGIHDLHEVDERGVNGFALAKRLIRDPKVCPSILALLGSLQTTHEGKEKSASEFNYFKASLVGLRRIRDDHNMLVMPTFNELLEACLEDLKQPDSALMIEASRQHYGSITGKNKKARREKLKQRCIDFQKLESNVADKPKKALRGQHYNSANQIVRHPHMTVLDCFQPGTESDVLLLGGGERRSGNITSYSLPPNEKGLFNTFFDGASGKAELRRNEKTSDEYLQLVDGKCQPADLVFKKKGRGDWQVSLDQTTWSVHPGFLLDNPGFKVPFEGRADGQLHRDWLPLRDASGNTAILVLRKTPRANRYFLYEMGSDNTLIPRLIGPGFSDADKAEAEFLYKATHVKDGSVKATGSHILPEVVELEGANRHWIPQNCTLQLQKELEQCVIGSHLPRTVPLVCSEPTVKPLRAQRITLNTLREISRTKRTRQRDSGVALVTKAGGSKGGQFSRFSVDATFEKVGNTFLNEKGKSLEPGHPLIEGLKSDQTEFRQGAFRDLTIYKGCELDPAIGLGQAGRVSVSGSPGEAQVNLDKVIKINRDHCMRGAQSHARLKAKLLKGLRACSGDSLKGYTDRQVLDRAVAEFEQGRVPAVTDQSGYIHRMTDLMLVENDLEQSGRIGRRLQGLRTKLETLAADCQMVFVEPDISKYQTRCQEWNLDMALLATQQKSIDDRLESYQGHALDTETLAILSFERRARTVLRPNQVQEVKEALSEITEAMEEGGRMQRISHKGTGWGKSTVLQLLTDHASVLTGSRDDLSVLVVAPESNQAELDIMLERYYAQKGKKYQRLDLTKLVHDAESAWWTSERLDLIHNTLLGISPATPADRRAEALSHGRGPVGASIKDIQILMNLRNGLRASGVKPEVLEKLNNIMDLLRESMTFCDEWDSAMLPHRRDDLKLMAAEITGVLKGLEPSCQVSSEDIIRCHGEFVLGSRRKQLLSATTGTTYTAALASGSVSPNLIKTNCNTDPFTTNQRFRHWLCSAQPVYFSSSKPGSRATLADGVIDRVGTECQVMMFDGRDKGSDVSASAKGAFDELNAAREKRGGAPKGILFYDGDKHLRKYQPGDKTYEKKGGGQVPEDEEAFLRAEGGASVDVYLSQRESVGTDVPQGQKSVGIYMGLLEQAEAREDLVAQQIGRMMRASNELRKSQKLFIAVDVDKLPDGEKKKAFLRHKEQMEDDFMALEEKLGAGLSQCSPEQKALIYAPLNIAPPEDDTELDHQIDQAVAGEVKSLRYGAWKRAQLGGEIGVLLEMYKLSESQAKRAWLELTAVELSSRDSSDHTKACETLLAQARVNSYLDDAVASEKQWLFTTGPEAAKNFEFQAQLKEQLPQDLAGEQVVKAFRSSGAACLKDIGRREIEHAVKAKDMPGCLDPQPRINVITGHMNGIRQEGIARTGTDELIEIRAELKQEGLDALTKAGERVKHLLEKLEPTNHYGRKGLENVCTKIDKLSNKLKTGTDDDLMGGQADLQEVYEMLQKNLLNVSINNKTATQLKNDIKDAVVELCREVYDTGDMKVDYVNSTVTLPNPKGVRQAPAIGVYRLILRGKAPNGRSGPEVKNPKSTVKKSVLEHSKDINHAAVATNPVGSRTKSQNKSRKTATNNTTKIPAKAKPIDQAKNLEELVLEARKLKQRQEWLDEATQFCSGPDNEIFKACVAQLEQYLLEQYGQFSHGQQEAARQAAEDMRKQECMMQQHMSLTVSVH